MVSDDLKSFWAVSYAFSFHLEKYFKFSKPPEIM